MFNLIMNQKLIFIAICGAVILAYFFIDTSGTIFEVVSDQLIPPNWNEVRERDIVKNSIPIVFLEKNNDNCKFKAENFNLIIDHPYFVRSQQLVTELKYDRENETLIMPCQNILEEKSRLNVWYAVEEADRHAKKYEYFITSWDAKIP